MRKVTEKVVGAFNQKQAKSNGNTSTDGQSLFLHGNKIAEWREDGLYVTNAGWATNVTKERLNAVQGVSVRQKDFTWYLNGLVWDGSWNKVA